MSAGLLEREKLDQVENEELEVEAPVIDFTRLYTLEEFLDLDLPDDDCEYELIRGKIVARKKAGTSAAHGNLNLNVGYYLKLYLSQNKIGRVFDQASCTLGRTDEYASYVEPDLTFVLHEKLPKDSNGNIIEYVGPITAIPDLVVEVISPSDTERIQTEKANTYLAVGVKLLWRVHSMQGYVVVQQLGVKRRLLLEPEDELDGGDVLPGFKLQVSKIFEL
jgi:Uma2 family endonuclease